MTPVARERRLLVERLRDLPDAEWGTPSLCAGWTVRHVLAHLCTPFLVSRPAFGATVLRSGGISGAMNRVARRLAERPPGELLDVLESNADSTFAPPAMPAAAPLTDAVVHSVDIRWALGDPTTDWGEPGRLVPVLDFLVSARAAAGFVPPGRLRGLRLVATDVDWQHGTGDEVRGPALPLAVAVLGRPAAAPLVTGAAERLLR